jgi:hypothetical protein
VLDESILSVAMADGFITGSMVRATSLIIAGEMVLP